MHSRQRRGDSLRGSGTGNILEEAPRVCGSSSEDIMEEELRKHAHAEGGRVPDLSVLDDIYYMVLITIL